MYDLIIIGAGPAGLSAAVYAARAELDFIVIEGSMMQGGQVLTTYDVDNYLGLPGIGGFDMGMKFAEHAKKLGVTFVTENVISMEIQRNVKSVKTDKNTYETKTIIIATGAVHKKAGIPGEAEFTGKGVSYCATCDGAFFKNKVTAVVGGGDVAVEDALYLSRMCGKVYLIHRRDEFRAAKSLVKKARETDNIEFVLDSVVEKIDGENKVRSINIRSKKGATIKTLEVDGVFFAVGMQPVTAFVDKNIEMNEAGYIIAGEDCATNIPGVYAAGDIRTKQLRQIITAAADGANAVTSVEKYIG
ncbi:thioredoxin reductase [Firmicutes bacterium CAG:882]|jgi:thioredoxin reductase (NADPH)|nr:thioredoxin reductase [Firmicutes bacterium CAG:882]